jgi:2,4-dienoyl-CoA reductase-like NADH-dependent reductase (Old Yellow Enzyme family)
MTNPFENCRIGNIEVKNRFIRSATHESMAQDGHVSENIINMYKDLSEGGTGLIITGYLSFASSDSHSPSTMRISDDEFIPGLAELTKTAHDLGTKVVAQINHSGSQLFSKPKNRVLAPSDVVDPVNGIKPEPFSKEEIDSFIKEFGKASLRAKKADFDGVQIHGAHSYLLSKFLSPKYNTRNDEYGGNIENNTKIIVEIIKEIKKQCGNDFPVWIKLNGSDFEENGITDKDFYKVCEIISKNGIDAIEVSSGVPTGKFGPSRTIKHKAYNFDFAKNIASNLKTDTIVVGGLREIDLIENILKDSEIKGVSLSRALVREPDLIKRWEQGKREPARCVACNGCYNPKGTKCFFTLNDEEKKFQKKVMKLMGFTK